MALFKNVRAYFQNLADQTFDRITARIDQGADVFDDDSSRAQQHPSFVPSKAARGKLGPVRSATERERRGRRS